MKRMIGMAATVIMAASLYGCGGSSALVAATVNLTGTWEIGEIITNADGICAGNIGDTSSWNAEVVQNGNDLTVTVDDPGADADGSTFSGTVSGDDVNWTGDVPTDGGISSVNETNITATDTTLEGTANWTWTDGNNSCSGTTRIQGYKM